MIFEVFPHNYDHLGDFHDGLASGRMRVISEVILFD